VKTDIKVRNIKQYTTTDRQTFSGKNAKKRAEDHQKVIDTRDRTKAVRKRLIAYLEEILGIGRPPKGEDYEDEQDLYNADEKYTADCTDIISNMELSDECYEDVDDIARLISGLFYNLGRKSWIGLVEILEGQESTMKPHGWVESTMGDCARTHMGQLSYWHFNLTEGAAKREKLAQIIESYFKIEMDISNKTRKESLQKKRGSH